MMPPPPIKSANRVRANAMADIFNVLDFGGKRLTKLNHLPFFLSYVFVPIFDLAPPLSQARQ